MVAWLKRNGWLLMLWASAVETRRIKLADRLMWRMDRSFKAVLALWGVFVYGLFAWLLLTGKGW